MRLNHFLNGFLLLTISIFLSVPMTGIARADTDTVTELEKLMADALRSYDGGDYEEAFVNWKAASDKGDTVAMIAIANMHLQGEGFPKSALRAATWYKKAAEKGDTIGQVNYGDFLWKGTGVPKNTLQAYVWLKLAGDRGNDWARDRSKEIKRTFSPEEITTATASYLRTKKSLK